VSSIIPTGYDLEIQEREVHSLMPATLYSVSPLRISTYLPVFVVASQNPRTGKRMCLST